MLLYLGRGWRNYAKKPIKHHTRQCWEIQAVLQGRIGPTLAGQNPKLGEKSWWIFPPGLAHGWTSDPETPAEVVVFHFDQLTDQFQTLFPSDQFLTLPLSPTGLRFFRQSAQAAYGSVGSLRLPDRFQHSRILHELLAMALKTPFFPQAATSPRREQKLVEEACRTFRETMHHSPDFTLLARQVGSSPASLRRHFHKCLGTSPRQVFRRLRLQQATRLLHQDYAQEEIAEICGYGSASAFSRAFKQIMGLSPRSWLQQETNP